MRVADKNFSYGKIFPAKFPAQGIRGVGTRDRVSLPKRQRIGYRWHSRSAIRPGSEREMTMLLRSTIRALDRVTARLGRTPKIAPHLAFGARGEDEAYFYLQKLGFTVIARDYRSPRRPGDIDLIAFEKETLCFVEVKTRATRKFLPAEAAVDQEKRATLSALAREYVRQYGHARGAEPPHRFDVISVYIESNDDLGDSADITLFRNAFTMS